MLTDSMIDNSVISLVAYLWHKRTKPLRHGVEVIRDEAGIGIERHSPPQPRKLVNQGQSWQEARFDAVVDLHDSSMTLLLSPDGLRLQVDRFGAVP
jgi:hypothetical protein